MLLATAAAGSAADPNPSGDAFRRYGAPPEGIAGHLRRLVAAYPEAITGFDETHLLLADGRRLPISDGRSDKSFEELLASPDIDDMFAVDYPTGAEPAPPPLNHDPGRIRNEELMRAIYGDCRTGEVSRRLRKVDWLPSHGGGTVSITTVAGADRALERVSAELDRFPGELAVYLVPSAGTYNCRTIAGTDRMSMHAYGAAIDINTAFTDYWKWTRPAADGTYRWHNRIPGEIVDVFERNGFVWGGRWYHFDTMHFEYRPELVRPVD